MLRHAGGVRVDHVIGLFRLWWIPEGRPPSEGTYVRYDHEALIGVLALEAAAGRRRRGRRGPRRRRAVGAGLPALAAGILGTSILWFERDDEGDPLPAERWRELCLASVTTHDLPPTAGYLAGDHVRLRDRLGLLDAVRWPRSSPPTTRSASPGWPSCARGACWPTDAGVEETVEALHRYLALTPARLLCVALTDAVGDRRTQNQPGTTDEYPNWRVPLSGPDGTPLPLEEVLTSTRATALARALEGALRGTHR